MKVPKRSVERQTDRRVILFVSKMPDQPFLPWAAYRTMKEARDAAKLLRVEGMRRCRVMISNTVTVTTRTITEI